MMTKCWIVSLFVVLLIPNVLFAADSKSDKTADAKPAAAVPNTSSTADSSAAGASTAGPSTTDSATTARIDTGKVKGRLPSGWGKLGITDAQKQAIYKVQASYGVQLDSLRKQVSDLEVKRDAEMRAVLTAAQQKQLDDLANAKAAKKAAAAEAKNVPVAASSNTTKAPATDASNGAAAADSTKKAPGAAK